MIIIKTVNSSSSDDDDSNNNALDVLILKGFDFKFRQNIHKNTNFVMLVIGNLLIPKGNSSVAVAIAQKTLSNTQKLIQKTAKISASSSNSVTTIKQYCCDTMASHFNRFHFFDSRCSIY